MNDRGTARAKARRDRADPSKASLRQIPPIAKGRFLGRGKQGFEAAKELFRARRGRPAKGETPEGTVTKTVRLPRSVYDELVRLAGEQGVSAHVALRMAVASWILKASERGDAARAIRPRKRTRKVA